MRSPHQDFGGWGGSQANTFCVFQSFQEEEAPKPQERFFSYCLNCICEGVIDLLPHFLLIKGKPQPARPLIWGTQPH